MLHFVISRDIEVEGGRDLTINEDLDAKSAADALTTYLSRFSSWDIAAVEIVGNRYAYADYQGKYAEGTISVHPGGQIRPTHICLARK
jgi:hypothetical protein